MWDVRFYLTIDSSITALTIIKRFFFYYLFIFLIYFLLFYCKFSSGPQINSLQANSCLVWGGGLRHPPYQSWTWLCKASLATNWYFQIIAYLFLNQNRQNPGTAENKKKRRKNKNKQKENFGLNMECSPEFLTVWRLICYDVAPPGLWFGFVHFHN